jgi:hypothetical protein
MKELLIFRIFALFPFIGILIPDMAEAINSSLSSIPTGHLIVEITLLVSIVICSAGIWLEEASMLKHNHKAIV